MAKGHFVYIPAMMRYTYCGVSEDFDGWRNLLEPLVEGMSESEIEVAIDEVDRAFQFSEGEEDLQNFARSVGAIDLPSGTVWQHFSDIKKMLEDELYSRNRRKI